MKIQIAIHDALPCSEITKILNDALRFDISIETVLLTIPSEAKGRSYGGLVPEYVISLFEEGLGEERDKSSHLILLTSLPIHYPFRYYTDLDNNITVASTYNLDKNTVLGYFSACALLAYGAYIRIDSSIEHKSKDRCVLNPSKYDRYIPHNICTECKKDLLYGGFLYVKRLHELTSRRKKLGHIVIILHGIRTFAPWYDEIAHELRKEGFDVISARYGILRLLKFFLNGVFGERIQNNFYEKYQQARELNPDAEISVLAHSYGTLVVSKAMTKFNDIFLDKIIFVNGIVPTSYKWSELKKNNRFESVINECGDKDIFPILADKMIPNAGASGSLSFDVDNEYIINHMHANTGHSDLLNSKHCSDVWVNFLLDSSFRYNSQAQGVEPRKFVRFMEAIPALFYWVFFGSVIIAGIYVIDAVWSLIINYIS